MRKLTIGEMAKINNISTQTLRLYDKMNILNPSHIDETNGYRYYTIRQNADLDMIMYLKSLGLTLNDIKSLLLEKNIDSINKYLYKKKEHIYQEIKELENQLKGLSRAIDSYERYKCSPKDKTIVTEFIPKRYMYLIDTNINFYDYDIDVYEILLTQIRNSLIANKLPDIYYSNVGSVMRQESILSKHFYSSEIFVFVDEELRDNPAISEIPANTYLCMYCDDFDNEKEYGAKLIKEAEENYEIIGDYICEVIADLPCFSKDKREMFIRLQVPISYGKK